MSYEVLVADDHAIIRDGLKKYWPIPLIWLWPAKPAMATR